MWSFTGPPTRCRRWVLRFARPAAFPITRQLLAHPLKKADALLAVSRFTVGRVERLTKRPAVYVGAGVDVEAFHPGPAPAGTPLVGCVSRFVVIRDCVTDS